MGAANDYQGMGGLGWRAARLPGMIHGATGRCEGNLGPTCTGVMLTSGLLGHIPAYLQSSLTHSAYLALLCKCPAKALFYSGLLLAKLSD